MATSPVSSSSPLPPHGPPGAPEGHRAHQAAALEESVFGVLDGVVTSLALAVSVAAIIRPATDYAVFLTVFAAAVAGSLSMFVGALLSARSRRSLVRAERAREEWEVEHFPEVERREVLDMYRGQGFSEEEAQLLTTRICADKKRWVDMMMRDELGLGPEEERLPTRHGAVIGLAYLIGAAVPGLPFLIPHLTSMQGLVGSLSVGGLELVTIGVIEARFSSRSALRGAGEILLIGLGAALAVFLVTAALQPPG